jgi:hypothetical protein
MGYFVLRAANGLQGHLANWVVEACPFPAPTPWELDLVERATWPLLEFFPKKEDKIVYKVCEDFIVR